MNNPFIQLQDWTLDVLDTVKKDLKVDHLPSDQTFYKAHFGSRPLNRLGNEEILKAYSEQLLSSPSEDLTAFVINRWVFKHGDLYQHFADKLSQINPDFDEIQELTAEQSRLVLEGALASFGAIKVYLFAVLNAVALPKEVFASLKAKAEEEKRLLETKSEERSAQQTLEKILASHEREVARLNDKILGVQKKYTHDMESLKKQIRALQKQLAAK